MSRRSFLVGAGLFAVLIAGTIGGVWLLLRYEPRSYARLLAPAEKQSERSWEFSRKFSDLLSGMKGSGDDGKFLQTFTTDQVNSYLAEGVHKHGLLPDGVSDPRVAFEDECLRIAFRYRSGFLNTVISARIRVWLPGGEPNLMAVQLKSFQAGLIPISAQWLLEQAAEVGRAKGIEVSWYRHEGCPVAILRFQADKQKPTITLQRFSLTADSLTIQGESAEARPTK